MSFVVLPLMLSVPLLVLLAVLHLVRLEVQNRNRV